MAQIAKVRCNFWHEHKIYKLINHTFAKENLLWYNLSIKGGFTINNTLFEQFSGTYTKQDNYLLSNLTLPAEEETSYIGVWGQRRLTYLKHHRKVLYYNLLTSRKLHPPCRYRKASQSPFSSADKRPCRKRKCNRRTKSNRPNEMGSEDK